MIRLLLRCTATLLVLLSGSNAVAQSLEIEEKTDALTLETAVVGGPLKVCKAEGMRCAALRFAWVPSASDSVTVSVEVPELASVQKLQLRMNDAVHSFESTQALTKTHHEANSLFGSSVSSSNTFVLPVEALRALAEQEPALLRVSGVDGSTDYDFRKRAKMRGLPVDELRQFLAAIAEHSPK